MESMKFKASPSYGISDPVVSKWGKLEIKNMRSSTIPEKSVCYIANVYTTYSIHLDKKKIDKLAEAFQLAWFLVKDWYIVMRMPLQLRWKDIETNALHILSVAPPVCCKSGHLLSTGLEHQDKMSGLWFILIEGVTIIKLRWIRNYVKYWVFLYVTC